MLNEVSNTHNQPYCIRDERCLNPKLRSRRDRRGGVSSALVLKKDFERDDYLFLFEDLRAAANGFI